MIHLRHSLKTLFLATTLTATLFLVGCAHRHDDPAQWHKSKTKWYYGDMDPADRRFFLGSFLEHE